MSRALWHRHWIDTVGGLFVAVPITLVLCGRFAWHFAKHFNLPAYVERYRTDLGPLFWPEGIVPFAIDTEPMRLMTWEIHADVTVWLSVGLILFIWGSGIRSNNLTPRHPSIYYNLTLPVSRTRLVLTRYLMSVLCAVALMLVLLLSNSLVAVLHGFPLPLAEMAQTTLMGTLVLCACLAVFCCVGIVSETLLGWLIAAGFALLIVAGDRLAQGIVAYPLSPRRVTVLVAVTFGALAGAVTAAYKRDF